MISCTGNALHFENSASLWSIVRQIMNKKKIEWSHRRNRACKMILNLIKLVNERLFLWPIINHLNAKLYL